MALSRERNRKSRRNGGLTDPAFAHHHDQAMARRLQLGQ